MYFNLLCLEYNIQLNLKETLNTNSKTLHVDESIPIFQYNNPFVILSLPRLNHKMVTLFQISFTSLLVIIFTLIKTRITSVFYYFYTT